MTIKKIVLSAAVALFATTVASAQQPALTPIPDDTAVRKGVLDNGMTYYIRHNEKPAGQAEFWIFHNVGAMQEEDAQDGLAHFLEHMAFNGTKNFPDKNLITWLESIGVKFGVDLNAATGQEMTFYRMSNVPVARESVVDSALLILHDWSYFIALEDEEIDNERGVIIEELRTREGADYRIGNERAKYVFGKDNKYAKRRLIGTENGLRTFSYKEIRDFYHRWYRTDMQAIVVVGDIDVDDIENKLKATMADIPAVENPEQKQVYKVADNEEPIVAILSDPELTDTGVEIYFKRPTMPLEYNGSAESSMEDMVDYIISMIASERFGDITNKPDAPFLGANLESGNYVTSLAVTVAGASAREGESVRAFEALYTEIERLARFGVTESELDRAKEKISRQVQNEFDGSNDRRHESYVWGYINNFAKKEAMPSAQDSYDLDNMLLKAITTDIVNSFIENRLTMENQVIIVTAPDKGPGSTPTEAELTAAIDRVMNTELEPIKDDFVAEPLIPASVKLKGSKVTTVDMDKFGATVLKLKNGVRVVVKPTDFKTDEVQLSIAAVGGNSLLPTDYLESANQISAYVGEAGLGKFTASDLRKQLSSKLASLSPNVGSYSAGFSGAAAPEDIETLLQLVYLSFTSPRFEQADFDRMTSDLRAQYRNLSSNPMFILSDSLTNVLYDHNPRRQILTYDDIDKIDFDKLQASYRTIFGDPNDFTFTFVGNVDLDVLRPLAEKYLGSLPRNKASYKWTDDGVRFPVGMVKEHFDAKMEMPKTSVIYVLTGDLPYSLENEITMEMLVQVLNVQYTATIREEKGATYGVSAFGRIINFPEEQYMLAAQFDTSPEQANDVKNDIILEIEKIAGGEITSEQLAKGKEYFAKNHPDELKQNGYWLNTLHTYYLTGNDMMSGYMDVVNSIGTEQIKALAAKILSDGNVVEVLMWPAKTEAAEEAVEAAE